MAHPDRVAKVADRIREIVARRLDRGLRDPRLGFVTITDVRVTGDLQHATVFYTVYGSQEERRGTAEALKAATGMLRSEVGRQLKVRLTPTLEFVPDAIPENAATIEALLREAAERDEAARKLAENAEYAGDPDPYVRPADEEGEDMDDDEFDEDEYDDDDDLDDLEDDDEEDDELDEFELHEDLDGDGLPDEDGLSEEQLEEARDADEELRGDDD